MKKITLAIVAVFLIFLLDACALEIANVIGPDGGYVYYDKGNYDGGWRYKQCSAYDHAEIKDKDHDTIIKILGLLSEESAKWYSFAWELPEEADLRKILECFSYGLTKFSPDHYYLAINKPLSYTLGDPYDPDTWEVVILHKNFDNHLNGKVEKVEEFPEVVKVRPIRRF